ncbi:MAG: hypothetical protein ABGW50_01610 [Thermococcus sp.]
MRVYGLPLDHAQYEIRIPDIFFSFVIDRTWTDPAAHDVIRALSDALGFDIMYYVKSGKEFVADIPRDVADRAIEKLIDVLLKNFPSGAEILSQVYRAMKGVV